MLQAIQDGVKQSKDSVTGFLFGAICDAKLYIHGYAATSSECQDSLNSEVDTIVQSLPGGT